MPTDAEIVADYARGVLPLEGARLGDDFYVANLAYCVIDAVFSIQSKYEAVRNVLDRYEKATGRPRLRKDHDNLPSREAQQSISDLCALFEKKGLEEMTQLFGNRGRTSPKGGILKAEAVGLFALALRKHGVEHLQDVEGEMENEALEKDIRAIPGQGTGITLSYFWMLAGSDRLVKPDTMVIRFLETALHRTVAYTECQRIVSEAARELEGEHPQMTPRLLDHLIWGYQRDLPSPKAWSTADIDRMIALLGGMEEEGFVVATWAEAILYPTYHRLVWDWNELLNHSTASFYAYTVLREDPIDTLPNPSLMRLYANPGDFASASLDGIRRYFALCWRAEKFGDGFIANEFSEGRMAFAMRRLRELRAGMAA